MKHKLILLSAILVLLFGCIDISGNVPPTPPPQKIPLPPPTQIGDIEYTWVSSPLFFIYYPKGWEYDEPQNGVFTFTAPEDDINDDMNEQFIVEIWSGNQSTPEEFEAVEKDIFGKVAALTINKRESVTYKGKDAFVLEMEQQDPILKIPLYYKTTYFRNGKWVYRLHYAVEKSRLSQYQPIMENILDQFKISSAAANS